MTSFPIPSNYANHILVASPSNVVRQRVLESLRSPVRRFEQATGGAEALVHLESGFWQVLFLDRRLPDLDAEELSQTVRQRYPGIEVVLLDPEAEADFDRESDPEPALNQGSDDPVLEMWPVVSNRNDHRSENPVAPVARRALRAPPRRDNPGSRPQSPNDHSSLYASPLRGRADNR